MTWILVVVVVGGILWTATREPAEERAAEAPPGHVMLGKPSGERLPGVGARGPRARSEEPSPSEEPSEP